MRIADQFAVHRNLGAGKAVAPFLLILQHPVARQLETRLVAPLLPATVAQPVAQVLLPVTIDGVPFICSLAEIAAVPCSDCGDVVASLESRRFEILNAIDFLINGY